MSTEFHEVSHQELSNQLRFFERKYGLSTHDFSLRWQQGQWEDTWDANYWAILFEYALQLGLVVDGELKINKREGEKEMAEGELPVFKWPGECPACGCDVSLALYHDLCLAGSRKHDSPHMHRFCERCKFDWLEAPLFTQEKTDG